MENQGKDNEGLASSYHGNWVIVHAAFCEIAAQWMVAAAIKVKNTWTTSKISSHTMKGL